MINKEIGTNRIVRACFIAANLFVIAVVILASKGHWLWCLYATVPSFMCGAHVSSWRWESEIKKAIEAVQKAK